MVVELENAPHNIEVSDYEPVDREKELKAHEFRTEKRSNSPFQTAVLRVIRNDETLWPLVDPSPEQQRNLEQETQLPGETHKISAALFANIFSKSPEAAALYDVALYDTTQAESRYFKDQVKRGKNYAPVIVAGAGGVYGTIFSATFLKYNPDNPAFGFDAGKRRGGIWAIAGDLVLNKAWWRMNSRNRPERRKKKSEVDTIAPGTDDNINSLGAECQNLQVPDISSGQYPTNTEMGRVLSHDNALSNNLIINAELKKVRRNRDAIQKGTFQQEYQDRNTGERFFVYTDIPVQATGLGKESLGFSEQFSSTKKVLEQAAKDLAEGRIPKVATFFQLVEATTGARKGLAKDIAKALRKFGLLGKGDTSKVIRENLLGVGGINPGYTAQEGFVEEVVVFGLGDKTRDELRISERARYVEGLLEFARGNGQFFRARGINGRIVGLGQSKDKDDLIVYYQRTDETPEGPVTTIAKSFIPRLITAGGFVDMTNQIYSGINAEVIDNKEEIQNRFRQALTTPGSTIYYEDQTRIDIDNTSPDRRFLMITIIDQNNRVQTKMIDGDNPTEEEVELLSGKRVKKLEIAGEALEFEPVIDPEYDDTIPIAEKAVGLDVYKIGACTSYALTGKERSFTTAYEKIPENTKSIFRFVRPVVFFAKTLAKRVQAQEGALNLEKYQEKTVELPDSPETRTSATFQFDPLAENQDLPANIKSDTLLKYLAASRLNCLFPAGMDSINIAVKRIKSEDGKEPGAYKVQFSPALPDTPEWEVLDSFLEDPLTQRLIVNLTSNSTDLAELKIGLLNRTVDIRRTQTKSVLNREVGSFLRNYPELVEEEDRKILDR